MWNHFLHPGNRKKRIGRSRLSDVLSRRMALASHNLPSERQKMTLVNFMKRCFMVSKRHANIFSASRTSKKETSTKLLKWCFMKAKGPENS
jgi:hypothetical protein